MGLEILHALLLNGAAATTERASSGIFDDYFAVPTLLLGVLLEAR